MCWMCLNQYTIRQLDFNMLKALKLQSEKKIFFFLNQLLKKSILRREKYPGQFSQLPVEKLGLTSAALSSTTALPENLKRDICPLPPYWLS